MRNIFDFDVDYFDISLALEKSESKNEKTK